MKRFFYTNPLAAAWMVKHFGMRFANHNNGTEITLENILRHALTGNVCGIHIHPDSLSLLEPKVEDLGFDGTYAGVVANVSDSLITFETPERHNGKKYFCTARVAWKTVLRDGIAFHQPESEEV